MYVKIKMEDLRDLSIEVGAGLCISKTDDNHIRIDLDSTVLPVYGGTKGDILVVNNNGYPVWNNIFEEIFSYPTNGNPIIQETKNKAIAALKSYLMAIKLTEE
jgi:hypothetical protein